MNVYMSRLEGVRVQIRVNVCAWKVQMCACAHKYVLCECMCVCTGILSSPLIVCFAYCSSSCYLLGTVLTEAPRGSLITKAEGVCEAICNRL